MGRSPRALAALRVPLAARAAGACRVRPILLVVPFPPGGVVGLVEEKK